MLTLVITSVLALAGQTAEQNAPKARTAEAAPVAPAAYNPEGRRDPFVSLVGRGTEPAVPRSERAPGVGGLLITEITVKGVVRDRSGFIAMLQSPDNKTYIVRPGDKLLDGFVKTISQEGVTFAQDVRDPLSLVKQREISKRVRAGEGQG